MKTHAIIFTLGLLLGLFFSFMYRTLVIDFPNPPVPKRSVGELKKEVSNTEVVYAKAFDSLKQQSFNLVSELRSTTKSLHQVKEENLKLTTEVKFFIKRQKAQRDEPRTKISCDSLTTTVEHLMLSSSEKDSLYEAAIDNLTAQVANKDSAILLKDEQYRELKSTLVKSFTNQQSLIHENKLLGRQVKRQKTKSKLLSAALLIISGAAINQFIRR